MAERIGRELPRIVAPGWRWAFLLLVLVGSLGSNRGETSDRAAVVAAAVVAVCAALPLVVGADERFSLTISGLFTMLYVGAGFADGPVYLALPAVTFLVATQVQVRAWAPWAGGAVLLAAIGFVGRPLWLPDEPTQRVWQAVGTAALVAAAGGVATALRSRAEARAERAERTATEERLRMAQDLHDGVGHGLSVIAMQAGVALHVLERDPAKARESLEAIRETSKESLSELRAELAAMSGEAAPRRPSRGVADLPALVDRVRGAGLVVEVAGEPGEVPQRVGELCFAVVQEALTNVLRHAEAERARVEFDRADDATLVVSVTDDGRGSVPGASATGLGLGSLESRAAALGGTFESGPVDAGFRVRATLPITEVDR